MHIWLHKIEVIVDKLIAPILATILVVIIGEIFFTNEIEFYRHYADWFDGFVVIVFATDLAFKYSRVRKLPTFFRKYWLEIIATIPFFLIFRLLEFLRVTEFIEKGQAAAHEAAAAGKVEKEAALIVKEVARAGELSRTARIINTFRAISRVPRLLRAVPFYEKPTGKHHPHENRNA